MKIKSGIGIGSLKFGMHRKEVEAQIGKPDEIERNDGDEFESWHYDERELSLAFDQEAEWRLVTISVTSDEYLFEGKALIGMELEDFEDFISPRIFGEMDYEDCSTEEIPDYQLIEIDELSMNFWFEEDKLTEVQWSPLFDEEEQIIWPEEE